LGDVQFAKMKPGTVFPIILFTFVGSLLFTPAAFAGSDEITVAIYGGSFADMTKKCYIEAFENQYQVKVNVTIGNSTDNLAKLRAQRNNPQIDVAYMDWSVALQAQNEGLIDKLEPGKIPNMSEVYVVADVDETDIGKVKVGMPASINADAFPDLNLDGEVLRIAPLAKVEQNVTMFEVTTLVDNTAGLLKAGMNATVEVIMARADDALLIPAKAVTMKPPPRKPDVADTSAGSDRALAQAGSDPAG